MADAGLQKALANSGPSFIARRARAVANLPEFEQLRESARELKNHTLANLDFYLEIFADNVSRSGGTVHWCATAEEARETILGICRAAGARTVTKGKSMMSEEIGLNEHLERNGIVPFETDLGEYIIQLRNEHPSHIIAPAFHLSREDWEAEFRGAHTDLPADRAFGERRDMVAEARAKLRDKFLPPMSASPGRISSRRNGRPSSSPTRAMAIFPDLAAHAYRARQHREGGADMEDTTALLRLLTRSATGQDMSVYITFSTGPRRAADLDGPEEYHVVLLDNGRSAMIGTQYQDMLRCIRCAACLNHCPVYGAVGGHAYGWVYPGPMGSVLTPALIGIDQSAHLPNASTFCGKCERCAR